MSFRTTALLFGILIGLLCLFGVMLEVQRHRQDQGLVLPGLAKSKDITQITIARAGHKYVFSRDGGWRLRIDSYPPLRADEGQVDTLLQELKKVTKNEEADVTSNLEQWGLTSPAEKVTVEARGGEQWTLNVGKKSADGVYVYVNSNKRPNEVLPVESAKLRSVLIEHDKVHKYRSLQLLTVSDATAERIDLKPAASVKQGQEVILKKDEQAVWRFLQPKYGPADYEGAAPPKPKTPFGPPPAPPKESGGVRGLLNTLGRIQVRKEADFEPLDKAPFPREKAILRVEVDLLPEKGGKKGGKEILLIGEKVKDKDQYYARLDSDPVDVRVEARDVEGLLDVTRKPAELRSHDLAMIATGKPDVIKLSGQKVSGTITLYRPAPGEWRVAAEGLEHRANTDAVQGEQGLLGAVQGKSTVKKFEDVADEKKQGPAKDKELGLDTPVARVVVYVGGLAEKAAAGKKEPVKKGPKEAAGPALKDVEPTLTLVFGKLSGDNVAVKRVYPGGSVSRVFVPASVLDKFTPAAGALAFLDTNLAPFSAADVEKLELRMGKEKPTFVVQRAAPKEKDKEKQAKLEIVEDRWLMLGPKEFTDRPADREGIESVLDTLSRLTVVHYEKKVDPKAADLNAYGLKPAAVTAVVTLKKKGQKVPVVYTYEFGRKTPEEKEKQSGVYGIMTTGELKDIIFVAPAHEVKALEEAELRDRTVFNFDPKKVKEVRATMQEKAYEVDFDFTKREDGPWTVKKAPKRFKLDPLRVSALLEKLGKLRAVRFVSFSGPTKEQKFGDDTKVKLELVMDDKAGTTHTLLIGGADAPEGNYYAQSNALPRAVFLVSPGNLGPLVTEGASYFSGKSSYFGGK